MKLHQKILQIERIIKRESYFLIILFLLLAFFGLIFYLTNEFSIQLAKNIRNKKVKTVEIGLEDKKNFYLKQAFEISSSPELKRILYNNDINRALIIAEEEKQKRDISGVTIINTEGVVLARAQAADTFGDNVFYTSSLGRLLSVGKSGAMILLAKTNPLSIVGGVPIREGEKIIGAVVVGQRINDDFAKKFKQENLKYNLGLVFYSKTAGVLGTTFSEEEKALLQKYFNAGDDFILGQETNRHIKLGRHVYNLVNFPFFDPEDSQEKIGGVLIFIPCLTVYRDLAVSFFMAILFLFLVFLFYRYRPHKKRMLDQKIIKYFAFCFAVIIFIIIFSFLQYHYKHQRLEFRKPAYIIYNSILKFFPEQDVFDINFEQKIAVKVDTGGEAINAVRILIDYDPNNVEVKEISTINSFCAPSFFLEKEIDNKIGRINLTCVVPNPGFIGRDGLIAELLVQPKVNGQFSLIFNEESKILANDGLGTNVLRMVVNGDYRVYNFKEEELNNIIPYSITHPNSERWYNKRQVKFFWKAKPGLKYRYLFDTKADSIPLEGERTSYNFLTVNFARDGIYYFHLAAENENGELGPTAHFKFKIDATPPLSPLIKVSNEQIKINDIVRFEFSAKDGLSGTQDSFYVKVDDGIFLPSLNQLFIPFFKKGKHTIVVRVFDRADNYSEIKKEIVVNN